MKKLRLGIIGGGPGSWIGHVHRIASRFDDKYEIVAGVFTRNYKINQSNISISFNRVAFIFFVSVIIFLTFALKIIFLTGKDLPKKKIFLNN